MPLRDPVLLCQLKPACLLFAMPCQDPDIFNESPDQILVLIRLVSTRELSLISDFLARHLDFQFVFLFGLAGSLVYILALFLRATVGNLAP